MNVQMIIIFDKPINLTLQQCFMYVQRSGFSSPGLLTLYSTMSKGPEKKSQIGFRHHSLEVYTTDDEDDNDDDAVSVGNL